MRLHASFFLLAAAGASLAWPAEASTVISDPMRELSFAPPDGFVEIPGGSRDSKLSSWLTDAERSERLGFNVGAIAGTAAVVVVALLLALRRRKKS
jgi:hypothetical protein